MSDFLAGAVMLGCFAVALFFVRSWRRTGDRLLALFALAFFLLTLERWVLVLLALYHPFRPFVYVLRLAAFLTIIAAIIDKNRSPPGANGDP